MIKNLISFLLLLVTSSFTSALPKIKSVQDFPLQLSANQGTNNELVIYLTGDGGWNKFSQTLTREMEKEGYGIVTLNTRKYFRIKKNPDIFARDIDNILNFYMKEWKKTSVIIIGYSFGADVAAFLPRHLSHSLLGKMNHITLLSPSESTDFVINLSDLIGDSRNTKRKYKVEIELIETTFPVVCIFGTNEDLRLKNSPNKRKCLTIHKLPGNHHYKNNTALLVKMIGL